MAFMKSIGDGTLNSKPFQSYVHRHVTDQTDREPRRRTLLSINNYFYPRGGAEVVFLEQNRILEASGWQVVPFAMHHPRNQDTPWSRHFVEEVEYDHSQGYSLIGKVRRAAKVVYSQEARRNLQQLLDEVAVGVAHLHNVYHHISPSILGLLAERRIPTVMTLHDLKLACPAYKMLTHDGICERCRGGRLFNVVRHRCLKGSLLVSGLAYLEATVHGMLGTYDRYVDRFIVPSRFFLEKLSSWGVARERMVHIPNAVDVERFAARRHSGEDYFVYFGRLAPEKGIGTLLHAAGLAEVPLKVIGTGPEEADARRLAEHLGADVEFLGYLAGDALHDVIRGARAVVLPSEWYENAPMSVLEAYALGVPVIGADIGGIPELVREASTGAIFPSGDSEALAAVLRRFAAMPDAFVAQMGRAARALVEREFGSDVYQARVLALYRSLGVPC
jgi:glycosyltransferase involved in cell wall biosynthesis